MAGSDASRHPVFSPKNAKSDAADSFSASAESPPCLMRYDILPGGSSSPPPFAVALEDVLDYDEAVRLRRAEWVKKQPEKKKSK